MKKFFLFVSMAVVSLLTACSSSKGFALQGEWYIIAVNGTPVDSAKVLDTPYIGFEKEANRAYGCAGCNRFFTGMELDSVKYEIHFDNAGVTRMMCPNMETEDAIVKALNRIVRYKVIDSEKVDLCDADGRSLLLLRKLYPGK